MLHLNVRLYKGTYSIAQGKLNTKKTEKWIELLNWCNMFDINSNPNDPSATPPPSPLLGDAPRLGPDQTPYWDTYDTINQLYMEISA